MRQQGIFCRICKKCSSLLASLSRVHMIETDSMRIDIVLQGNSLKELCSIYKCIRILKQSTCQVKKLSPRYCGPFRILCRIGQTAYKIDLPSIVRVHPVFHVSCLKEALGGGDQLISPQDLIAVEDLSFGSA